jgi:ribose 1,5-bisphosphokinase PhnN
VYSLDICIPSALVVLKHETLLITTFLQSIEASDLVSVRVRKENLLQLKEVACVIFVGSSSVGKTTLTGEIRFASHTDASLVGRISVPKRIITRPPRENDDFEENAFYSPEEFESLVRSGEIGLHWEKKMEGTRVERYGFFVPDKGTLAVYPANNAVINNQSSLDPPDILQRALIVAVYAPEKLREKRLLERSPDLTLNRPDEVAHRLADRAINMYPQAHIVVKNFGWYIERTKSDVVSLMRLLIQNND